MVNITPSMLDLAIQLATKIQATALLISSECAAELTVLEASRRRSDLSSLQR